MLERAIADHKRMIEVDELECTDADRQLWAAAGLALDLV
jgi:hypothetical protein